MLGRPGGRAPPEPVLEDQPTAVKLTGELPTGAMLGFGVDEGDQERIADVQELFGGLGGDDEGGLL